MGIDALLRISARGIGRTSSAIQSIRLAFKRRIKLTSSLLPASLAGTQLHPPYIRRHWNYSPPQTCVSGLNQAQQLALTDSAHLNGIAVLEQLHAALIPQETALLPNYPNPFNPETWIPYRLAEDAFVTLTIYDTAGGVVRSIDVGYKPAAVYESKAKAIYWNGRNEFEEEVASGVYFYHLSAGDFSATRRMLILK